MPEIVNTSILNYTASEDPNDNREVVVDVDNVTMTFNMASENLGSLKEYFIKLAKRELYFEKFTALDKVSFQVRKGDVFGIMGTNGSGKSTLLKIMAGVLEPTSGTCDVRGNIAPLIELGAGFDTELSARENIYLNGALLGYSHDFIDEHFDEIVEFAEVKKFLDMPMKNYSSGMVSRIAFAIATVIVPEILLVDEVLSVGDLMFQHKCERRIIELIEKHGVTVLIVSHSDGQIARLCNKAVWLEKGHVRCMGPATDISTIYSMLGGRTGSADTEEKIFNAMTHAMESPEPKNIILMDFSPAEKGGVELVCRGWGKKRKKKKKKAGKIDPSTLEDAGSPLTFAKKKSAFKSKGLMPDLSKVDTVILIDPSTHISGMLAAPLSALMNAPVLAYDVKDPALETQYFLSSVAPANVVLLRMDAEVVSEDVLAERFSWNPNVEQIHSSVPLDVVAAVYEYGKTVGEWGRTATIIDMADNALGLAVVAQAARVKSPVILGLMDREDLAREHAEWLVSEGFERVCICGPAFPQQLVHLFEEAGLEVVHVAREWGNNNDNYSQIVKAFRKVAEVEGDVSVVIEADVVKVAGAKAKSGAGAGKLSTDGAGVDDDELDVDDAGAGVDAEELYDEDIDVEADEVDDELDVDELDEDELDEDELDDDELDAGDLDADDLDDDDEDDVESASMSSATIAKDASTNKPKDPLPIREIMVDAYSPSAWFGLLTAPAYLAHVGGALVFQDTTNLDSMVRTFEFCEQFDNSCKIIYPESANGLTVTDVLFIASVMKDAKPKNKKRNKNSAK